MPASPVRRPRPLALGLALALALLALHAAAQDLPDAPDPGVRRAASPRTGAPATYAQALVAWKSPEDIARFIDAAFVYDRPRALALGEAPASPAARASIHPPEAMFAAPVGVCVDLARFGVETLNRIDASFAARYVMLEFDPVVIEGRTLRRHWIASFRRDGKLWFFADSRRPGHVAGPYDGVADFVADYARYRGRSVVAWRETDTFLRRTRSLAQVR